jgi:hypothetical protein
MDHFQCIYTTQRHDIMLFVLPIISAQAFWHGFPRNDPVHEFIPLHFWLLSGVLVYYGAGRRGICITHPKDKD